MDPSRCHREVTSTLQALCRQEESTYKITGRYLASADKVSQRRSKCRSAMVTWFITVVDYLEFERETVAIALNYLDRFLETTAGKACLTTPRQFKMAGMTCLYTAIKAHEPEAIEPDLVVELSGNLCQVDDIEAMERTILNALHWRVNPPTALAFCRQLVGIVPRGVVSAPDCQSLLDLAQVQTELAVSDQRLMTTPPSLLALASIFNALESSKHSTTETLDDLSKLFFVALAGSATLDMDAVFDVQDVLDDIIRKHNQPQEGQEQQGQTEDDDGATHATPQADEDCSSALNKSLVASPTTPAKEMAISMAAASASTSLPMDVHVSHKAQPSHRHHSLPLRVVSPTKNHHNAAA